MGTFLITHLTPAAPLAPFVRCGHAMRRGAYRAWNGFLATNSEMDPLVSQVWISVRFSHLPPTPLELERVTRRMAERRSGVVRVR